MIFTVRVKSPAGRTCSIYYDSSNFEELLKKIFVIHGKNFVEVSYESRKNLDGEKIYGQSGKN